MELYAYPRERLGDGTAPVRLCVIADTHGFHDRLAVPEADLLIHAGDMTMSGTREEVADFSRWWNALPHPHKVVIAGNHDWLFQREPDLARSFLKGCVYLEDSEATVLGLRIYGSPWQPWFLDWAFNLRRGPEIRAKWDLIPKGVDLLLTHGPPLGRGDRTARGEPAGCRDLLDAVRGRVRPRWHVFGHIHEGYGITQDRRTTFVNASVCDRAYEPVNEPVLLEL